MLSLFASAVCPHVKLDNPMYIDTHYSIICLANIGTHIRNTTKADTPELKITVCHRSISDEHMNEQTSQSH